MPTGSVSFVESRNTSCSSVALDSSSKSPIGPSEAVNVRVVGIGSGWSYISSVDNALGANRCRRNTRGAVLKDISLSHKHRDK